ncbi:helix-turn-helix domain-containing protein [Aliiroseovarius sp. YM-037]|uniref:helix-turn-helix domain-containing protein n=1 Tax=Aliiroseovarius sp. YM-037 TaxID=3341728 RepID=UPI003A7FA925
MQKKTDKRDRAILFRERLDQALGLSDLNRSTLARQVGVDRSTISQLLSDAGPRLPNAHVVGECAAALGVSADWLLGLTDRPERVAELLAASVTMTAAPRALVDEQIFAWHREAAGYKIRHVPATLPDMLKTHAMLRWEYLPHLGRTTDQAIGASEDRLQLMRSAQSDYEIAMPLSELQSFARADGYYAGLPADVRMGQIDWLLTLHQQLYPRLRVYLFDARRLYSAPITVFGPLLAVLYLGSNYLAFRDKERIDAITAHFDGLVREARVSSRDLPETLQTLRAEIS